MGKCCVPVDFFSSLGSYNFGFGHPKEEFGKLYMVSSSPYLLESLESGTGPILSSCTTVKTDTIS